MMAKYSGISLAFFPLSWAFGPWIKKHKWLFAVGPLRLVLHRVNGPYGDPITDDEAFDNWCHELDEKVIQAEYGYERGEFTVFPDHWRSLYDDGLTPHDAFRRALKQHSTQSGR
jgi:hypothetical protein